MREFLTCKLLLELNKELPAFFFLSSFGQSDQYLFYRSIGEMDVARSVRKTRKELK
jgi:hypothetical protein